MQIYKNKFKRSEVTGLFLGASLISIIQVGVFIVSYLFGWADDGEGMRRDTTHCVIALQRDTAQCKMTLNEARLCFAKQYEAKWRKPA